MKNTPPRKNVPEPISTALLATGKISDVFGILKKSGRKALSINDMNKIIAKPNSKRTRMG
jgi:hypothetical protein